MNARAKDAADPVIAELYRLIRSGELAPGEHVDQRKVADMLQVSRTPLREGLRALAMDGVLVHNHNQGYAVAKLSEADLLELYALRTFVEDNLVRSIEWPNTDDFSTLDDINRDCIEAVESGDIELMNSTNKRFYFQIYSWSPLQVLYREAERLWRISEPYRAVPFSSPAYTAQIAEHHAEILDAVARRDKMALIDLFDNRRLTTRLELVGTLRAPVSEAHRALQQTGRGVGITSAEGD